MSLPEANYHELIVSSKDRLYGTSSTDFTVQLPSAIRFKSFRILSADIPYSFYNLVNTADASFDVVCFNTTNSNNTRYTVSVEPGNFPSVTALASAIQTALATATSLTWNVTFDSIKGLITIAITSSNYEFAIVVDDGAQPSKLLSCIGMPYALKSQIYRNESIAWYVVPKTLNTGISTNYQITTTLNGYYNLDTLVQTIQSSFSGSGINISISVTNGGISITGMTTSTYSYQCCFTYQSSATSIQDFLTLINWPLNPMTDPNAVKPIQQGATINTQWFYLSLASSSRTPILNGNSFISTYVVTLYPVNISRLQIRSSKLGGASALNSYINTSNFSNDLICSIPVNATFGAIITYQSDATGLERFFKCQQVSSFGQLDFRLTDSNGNVVNLNGSEWSMRLGFQNLIADN